MNTAGDGGHGVVARTKIFLFLDFLVSRDDPGGGLDLFAQWDIADII